MAEGSGCMCESRERSGVHAPRGYDCVSLCKEDVFDRRHTRACAFRCEQILVEIKDVEVKRECVCQTNTRGCRGDPDDNAAAVLARSLVRDWDALGGKLNVFRLHTPRNSCLLKM